MSEPNARDARLSSGFPNRRRAERLLCIKSECDRLMHSEGLFIKFTNSTPAWQGGRSTAAGV